MTTRRTKAKGADAKRQAAKGAKAGKGGPVRKKGSRRFPVPPGRAKAPGRVVAVGVDVPRLDELAAEAEAAKQAAKPDGYEFGRPTDYRPEFVKVAGAMARLGGTDFEIAEELGIKTATLWRWRAKYQDFCSAIDQGKDAFDNRIERSLAQRAAGYSYHSEKVFQYEGQVIRADIVEHVPPEVNACRLWLMNRRPDKWRDKAEVKLDGSDAFLKIWQAISDGRA